MKSKHTSLTTHKLNDTTLLLVVKESIRRKALIELIIFAMGAVIITGGICFGAGFAAGKATHEVEVREMIDRYYGGENERIQ